MLWLVEDFGLLSVILRALILTLQTLIVGGILFAAWVLPRTIAVPTLSRWLMRFATALAATGILYLATDSAILTTTTGLPLSGLLTADYFLSGTALVLLSAIIALVSSRSTTTRSIALTLLATALMVASVFTSHAISRLDHRLLLSVLTLLHQTAAAAWLGGIAFLLLGLQSPQINEPEAHRTLSRFSPIAIASVFTLAATGTLLSVFYVASLPALYGTAYGTMVISKAVMLLLLAAIGAVNWSLARSGTFGPAVLILIRRISQFELITAFAVLLMAASLTSQPPGVDLVEGRLTLHDLADHFQLRAPILAHPPLESLAPATPMQDVLASPDDLERAAAHTNRDPDLAWSEFEHNWAGIFLLVIGALGTISAFPGGRWARFWPLLFILMAIFLMVFSDPENWPLGPIGYWESFADPEVLLHRVALCILIVFGIFEAGVQTGRLSLRFALVFPILTVVGASAFLLHSHSLGNVRLELLTELSHTPISVFGILAGAFRLLQLWLTSDLKALNSSAEAPRLTRAIRLAAIAWPLCLAAAGLILLNYREG